MRLALKEKITVICLAAAAAAYGTYRIAWIPLDEKLTVLQQRQEEVKGLEVDITPLKKEAKKLEESCADLEKKAAGIKETAGKTFHEYVEEGFGLKKIYEKVRECGGDFVIDDTEGFTVAFSLPLEWKNR